MERAELAGALAVGREVRDDAGLLAGHVGDVLDLRAAVGLEVEADLGARQQPAAVERDAALGVLVLEHLAPGDLVETLRAGADCLGEVAEAVRIADDGHAVLVAVIVLQQVGALPVVRRPLPEREVRMVLDDRGIVALRPQDVLGATVEDEDIVCLAEIVGDHVPHEGADVGVGPGELHRDADGSFHDGPVLELRRGDAVALDRRRRRLRAARRAERARGSHRGGGRRALKHAAARYVRITPLLAHAEPPLSFSTSNHSTPGRGQLPWSSPHDRIGRYYTRSRRAGANPHAPTRGAPRRAEGDRAAKRPKAWMPGTSPGTTE